jgi:hypothetical protein
MTAHCAEQPAELATSELTCEYATNPLGVDTPRPRFGWRLKSEQRAQLQSAYLYQCHGDKRLVEHHCDRVKAWVDFIGRELAEEEPVLILITFTFTL